MENPSASPPSPSHSATPVWLVWTRVLLTIAIAGAGYLAWVSLHHGPAAGCGPESGCSKVLGSRWAYWLDLPVSLPALAVYLAFFGATILLQKRPGPDDQRGSWAALIALSVIVAGAGLWFIGLQVLVLKAFCKFCMTAHACGLTAALICLTHIPWAEDPNTPMWTSGSGKRGVPRGALLPLLLVGFAGVALLAGGQLLVQKERNVVKVFPAAGQGPQLAAGTAASTATNYLALAAKLAPQPPAPNPRLVAPGVLSLYSNQFLLKLNELPMIGPPTATNLLVCLFDYTCPHCRALHEILIAAQRHLSNQLGVVCLPMPLSTNCNPFLPPRTHAGSNPNPCEYARLGLAVWRAKPEVHRQYEKWLFEPVVPAPVEEAKTYAATLVGTNQLQAALADPWVEQQLYTDCRLHYTNWITCDSPALPQLIIGQTISSGPLNSVQHLLILLQRYLGMDVGWNRLTSSGG